MFPEGLSKHKVEDFKIMAVRVLNNTGTVTGSVSVTEPFSIEIDYEVREKLPFLRVGFQILTTTGVLVFETYDLDNEAYAGEVKPGHYTARCEVPAPLLNAGYYFINLQANVPRQRRLAFAESVLSIEVADTGSQGSYTGLKRQGVIRTNFEWKREMIKGKKK